MARFRSSLIKINTLKHVVDLQGGLIVNTQAEEILVDATDAPVAATNPQEIENTSSINAVFLNVQVAATSTAALANVYMYVAKNPGNNLTMPNANAVGKSDNRRHVLHQEMIMTEKNTTAIPRTLFKGVIKIPRGKQRFGVDDRLSIFLLSPGTTYDYCIQCIYKEIK